MAKVTQPLGSSEARGSLGGYVYNTWRGISTVRTRVTPKTEYSSAQTTLRALTAACTTAWKALTNAQRHAWEEWADEHLDLDWTGNPKRLSGYNWFVRLNVRAQLCGNTIQSLLPTKTVSYILQITAYNASSTQLRLYWNYDTPPDHSIMNVELYIAGPYSAARNPTIADAKRYDRTNIANGHIFATVSTVGWYHMFFRVMLNNGVCSGWDRRPVQFTGT